MACGDYAGLPSVRDPSISHQPGDESSLILHCSISWVTMRQSVFAAVQHFD
jgi:hypothetical protein